MNLLQSTRTYDELLILMEVYDYSACHIKRVNREIKWLAANQDDYGISSYEKACRIPSGLTESESMREQYRSAISACSELLLFFQESGHETLEKISEKDVLAYFAANNGMESPSSSTKVNIAFVFRADMGIYTEDARRVLSYLPALRRNRKTIALVNKNWTLKLYFFTYNLLLFYSRICFPVLLRRQIPQ